ncbi:MAG: Holliday junction branch migration protein RuvA [Candidatus Parcubacteria bacterium]|jgi:Holliday junction DNA helicase RuvA|uniref:Holliday junction branch migration protein RuvA n=1 Tax=Phormidesmis priestleyi TaxID=268141 RepID=UPI00083A6EA3|nr:Holliday junction branch migration protein RuvA [Phormidesmis priestleyi]MBC7825537.1 Holliday junction branch migration protein RuvA [Leptolyngbyaceae cyanobacterium LF-bin-113]
MIGYLKGTIAGIQKSSKHVTLTLEVNQIGYDLQIVPRLLQQLPEVGEDAQIFTHLNVREDQVTLFGFSSSAERDLFRQLVSVSGIGPQLALALLDTLGLQDLVQAIVAGNTRLLSRTPGVGSKTAERIALELKTKLAEWRQQSGIAIAPGAGPATNILEDVEMTLLALGYTDQEITQALQAVGQSTTLSKTDDAEAWIRQSIAWLSQ